MTVTVEPTSVLVVDARTHAGRGGELSAGTARLTKVLTMGKADFGRDLLREHLVVDRLHRALPDILDRAKSEANALLVAMRYRREGPFRFIHIRR